MLCEQEEVADAAGPSNVEGGAKVGEQRPRQHDRPKSHVADMLGAMAALQQQERCKKLPSSAPLQLNAHSLGACKNALMP